MIVKGWGAKTWRCTPVNCKIDSIGGSRAPDSAPKYDITLRQLDYSANDQIIRLRIDLTEAEARDLIQRLQWALKEGES